MSELLWRLKSVYRHYFAGEYEHAENLLDQIAPLPTHPEALLLKGWLREKKDDLNSAIRFLDEAVRANSRDPLYYCSLAVALRKAKRHDEAFTKLGLATMLDPRCAAAYYEAGITYSDLRNFEKAEAHLLMAFDLAQNAPFAFETMKMLATVLSTAGNHQKSLQYCFRASEIKPDDGDAAALAGMEFNKLGDHRNAQACFEKALQSQPHKAAAWLSLIANSYFNRGEIRTAREYYKRAYEQDNLFEAAYTNTLFALIHESDDRDLIDREHQQICEKVVHHFPRISLSPRTKLDKRRKIKIGYLSPDFREHAVMYILEPLLENHDRNRFEIYCYYDFGGEDVTTERVKKYSNQFIKCDGWSTDKIVQRISQDGVDILVNLSGHSGTPRIEVFARKPAPIQISWVSYKCRMGLSTIDYRFTDDIITPPGTPEFEFEKSVKLSHAVPFKPSPTAPQIRPLPAEKNGYLTFGCFNESRKMSRAMIETWAEILRRIPDSKMIVLSTQGQMYHAEFLEKFTRLGIAPERLVIRGRQDLSGYFQCLSEVDVTLDTFPEGSGVAALQSLWMGVPMLAWEGRSESSRTCSSILQYRGLGEFVARSRSEYIEKACALPLQIGRLADLRRTMRSRFDENHGKRFTAEVEAALKEMWNVLISESE